MLGNPTFKGELHALGSGRWNLLNGNEKIASLAQIPDIGTAATSAAMMDRAFARGGV
jgi:hypothetical protein